MSYALCESTFVETVVARSVGVSYPAVNASDVATILITIPSLSEQRVIANFLNAQTAKLDTLMAMKQELIELLKEKRTTLISRTVTRGLPPEAARAAALNPYPRLKPSGIEWLGDIPESWRVTSVKRLAMAGKRTFTDGDWIEAPFITDEGVRLIQTGNIGIGMYKEQGFRFISEDTFYSLRCTEIRQNDVLICRLDGPVGRACLVPELGTKMITSVDNAILKVNDQTDPRFIVRFMSSTPWLNWIETICRAGGGFRFRISRAMLGEIKIPTPPLAEQRAIADYLDRETAKIDRMIEKINAAIEKLQEYRAALITAAVTGKIDVRAFISDVKEVTA